MPSVLPALIFAISPSAWRPCSMALASDIDAGNIGLEVGPDHGQIDTAGFAAEDQGDGIERAGRFAGPVADALTGLDQLRLAIDDAENIALGAGVHARTAAHAFCGIDKGVEGRRFVEAAFDRSRNCDETAR
jgi:hypothetical protein